MSKYHAAPYINFQGRAREAMEHYQRALGGSLQLFTHDDSGKPKAAGPGDSIMHARLESDGVVIVASDGNPKYKPAFGDHIGITLIGSDEVRLRHAFDVLAEGGKVKAPLTKMPWGTAGWLTDRFGINWNVDVEA